MKNKFYSYILGSAVAFSSLSASAEGYYQIPNGGFEMEWTSGSEPGGGLHSFDLAVGNYKGQVNKHTAEQVFKVDGRQSKAACMIKSIQFKALGIVTVKANGNLTTGVIVAGATSATNKGNHNETQIGDPNTSLRFAGLPDSVSFYTKFKRGESGDYNANADFIIHGPVNYVDTYQSDYDNDKGTDWEGEYLTASNVVPIAPSTDWVRNVQAIEYKNPSKDFDERYLLVSFTTNPKPGATKDDELTIDDIEFIYNSKLASVKIGGEAVAGFSKDKFSYNLDADYNENIELEFTTDAKAATVTKKFDSDKHTLTITVEGNDISVNPTNKHEYVFQFKESSVGVELVKSAVYTDVLLYEDFARVENEKQVIKVDYYDNNTCDVTLVDFTFLGKPYIGDIVFKGLTYISSDSIRFSGETDAEIQFLQMTRLPAKVAFDAVSSKDYDKMKAVFNLVINTSSTAERYFGYEKNVILNLTDTIKGCIQVNGGVMAETDASVAFYNSGMADVRVEDVFYQNVPYKGSDGVYTFSSDSVSGRYTKDTLVVEATLPNGSILEFGKCVIPKVVKSITYTDYLRVNTSGKWTEPKLSKVVVNYYNTNVADITFADIDPQVKFAEIPFTKSDSIYFKSLSVKGSGSILYTNLQLIAEKGGSTYEFGYYKDEEKVPTVVKKATYAKYFHIDASEADGSVIFDTTGVLRMLFAQMYDDETMELSVSEFGYGDKRYGSLVVGGLSMKVDGDSIRFSGKNRVSFTSISDTAVGPSLGDIDVEILSASTDDDLNGLKFVAKMTFLKTGRVVNLNYGYKTRLHSCTQQFDCQVLRKGYVNDVKAIEIYSEYYDDREAKFKISGVKVDGDTIGDIVLSGLSYEYGDKNDYVISETHRGTIGGVESDIEFSSEANSYASDGNNGGALKKAKLVFDHKGVTTELYFGYSKINGARSKHSITFYDTIVVSVGGKIVEPVYNYKKATVKYYDNGYATLLFPDFYFGKDLIGDVFIDSLPYVEDDLSFSGVSKAVVTSENPSAIGVEAGVLPVRVDSSRVKFDLIVYFQIDLTSVNSQIADVSFGVPPTVKDTVSQTPEVEIVKTHTFKKSTNVYEGEKFDNNYTATAEIVCFSDENVSLSIKGITCAGKVLGDITFDSIAYVYVADSIWLMERRTVSVPTIGDVEVEILTASARDYSGFVASVSIFSDPTIRVEFGEEKPVIDIPAAFTSGKAVYTDSLVVSVDGESAPAQMTDIIVDYAADGTCTLSIMNFVMGSGDEAIEVGDIVVPGVPYTVSDSVRLSGSKVITIDSEMGEMLGEIPVTLTKVASNLDKTKLVASIDIDMTESIGQVVNVKFGHTTKPVIDIPAAFTPSKAVYTDSLVVSVDGESAPAQMTDIIVDYAADGTCTLSIMNFVMGSGDEAIEVGDIVVPGVPYTVSDSVRLSGSKVITIDSEMGEMLGEIPVTLTKVASNLDKTKLVASIDIDMTESIGQVVNVKFGHTTVGGGSGPVIEDTVVVLVDMLFYTDSMYISTNGKRCSDALGEITVALYSDSTAEITVHDFSTFDSDNVTILGSFTIKGIKYSATEDSIYFSKTVAKVQFESDDEDAVGSYFGDVDCQLSYGVMDADKTKLKAKFDLWLSTSTVAVSFGYMNRTGLGIILADEASEEGMVYTVSGVSLGKVETSSLKPGVYIRNGKKFLVRR